MTKERNHVALVARMASQVVRPWGLWGDGSSGVLGKRAEKGVGLLEVGKLLRRMAFRFSSGWLGEDGPFRTAGRIRSGVKPIWPFERSWANCIVEPAQGSS